MRRSEIILLRDSQDFDADTESRFTYRAALATSALSPLLPEQQYYSQCPLQVRINTAKIILERRRRRSLVS